MRRASGICSVRCCADLLFFMLLAVMFNVAQVWADPSTGGWTKTYGGANYDYAYALVQTSDGGYALAGRTQSYGDGNTDAWLVKTDAFGNAQWNKTYGGTGYDCAHALVQTSDGGYALAGEYDSGNGDFWLVKTDAFGNAQWNKTYGYGWLYGWFKDTAHALVQTGDGGYALTGSHSPELDYYFWLVKTDAFGNAQWSRHYGGTGGDYASSVVQTIDGGYALAGSTGSFGAGSDDCWLVKTDDSGNQQWNKTYGGTEFDAAYALVQTGDGGYALAGRTESFGAGYADFWLVKTDENGVIPEFPSFLTLPLFAALTTIVVILAKKRLPIKVDS